MITKDVTVRQTVQVTVDESKFTDEFMSDFRMHFYRFHTLNQHIEHLAQLHARGIADDHSFIEGYGLAREMGIRFATVTGSTEAEVHS